MNAGAATPAKPTNVRTRRVGFSTTRLIRSASEAGVATPKQRPVSAHQRQPIAAVPRTVMTSAGMMSRGVVRGRSRPEVEQEHRA